jgi:hypothetical protein
MFQFNNAPARWRADPHAQQRRRQLASSERAYNRPVFAQLMLDEAISESDPQFAQQASQAFRKFGFQLVMVATVQNATTIRSYIDWNLQLCVIIQSGRVPIAPTFGTQSSDKLAGATADKCVQFDLEAVGQWPQVVN